MRRICALLLMLALTIAPIYAQAAETKTSGEMVELLLDLGIITDFKPESDVTIESFAKAISVITGFDNVISTYFGLVSGVEALKYSEMLILLVDICGYTPQLEAVYGGANKDSYITLASRLGITRGVTVKFDETVKMDDYARMMHNTLFVDVLEHIVYGSIDRYETTKGNDVLRHHMGIARIDGVVEQAGAITLSGEAQPIESAASRKVTIGGKAYVCTFDFVPESIIGRSVRAYVNEDETDVLAAIVVREQSNETVIVEGDSFVIAPGEKKPSFTYYVNGRERMGRLSQTANVVYNGTLLTAYEEHYFLEGNTVCTFVDNDLDGSFDVVIIDDYFSFVIQASSSDGFNVMDTSQNMYSFEDFYNRGYTIINNRGKAVAPSQLSAGMVLSVRKDKDGGINKIVFVNRQVDGTLQETNSDYKYIVVDDVRYECEKRYLENSSDLKKILPGSKVTLYLDVYDRAVLVRCYENVKTLGWLYGAIEGSQMKNTQLGIFDQYGSHLELYASSTVNVNGISVPDTQLLKGAPLVSNGAFVPQLVRFRANSKGEVHYIETAVNEHAIGGMRDSDSDTLTLNYDYVQGGALRALRSSGKIWMASKYVAESTGILFVIDTKDIKKSAIRFASDLVSGSSYSLLLYNVDENYSPEVIVSRTSTAAENSYIDEYRRSYLVKYVTTALDDEGNEIAKVYLYDNSGNVIHYTAENPDIKSYLSNVRSGDSRLAGVMIKDLLPGSIIQVMTNTHTSNVYSFALQFMPMQDNSELVFEGGNTNMSWDYGLDEKTFNGNGLYSYGRVLRKTNFGIVTNYHKPGDADYPLPAWNRHILFANTTAVKFFDRSTQEVHYGNWADILVDDMIFMQRNGTAFENVVVYR